MNATGAEPPQLKTPEGGAMSQPDSPGKWHGHPYVWAFHAIGGSLGGDYIESVCKQAEAENAPPDAVYKTRPDDKSMPSEWITVGLLANADQQDRTRRYAQTLVDWADALKVHRKQLKVQPLREGKQPEPKEYDYSVAFVARITGTVKAASFQDAMRRLAPAEYTGTTGSVAQRADGLEGVTWYMSFDADRADMVSTSDPRMHTPQAPQVESARGVAMRRRLPVEAPQE